ncbi:MAG: FAD-binding oxidoreductase [Trueperaceae bacterium]|nr:FAD-binding oxidoreductase [Trueperaceae bacterium]
MKNTPIWETGEWQGLPGLTKNLETDVCVVGLGGSGLSCIHRLVELGQQVIGLDAGMVAGGAAGRNGGFVMAGLAAFYHDAVAELGRERASAIYQASLEQTERILTEAPEVSQQPGSLRIALSPDELEDCSLEAEALRTDGFEVEDYHGPEGQGLLFLKGSVFNPLTRCRTLARRATDKGARLFENSPVVEVAAHKVTTEQAEIYCKHVIVAVDGRLELLLPELTGKVRTARLQMLGTEPTTEVQVPRPVYLRYGYEYYQQLPGGSIALGGFRDKAKESEWTKNNEPSEFIQEQLTAFLRNHIGVTAPISHRWAASVSYSEGVLPYFGEARPGVWAMGGYSGTGNVIGALCGIGAAEKLIKGSSSIADLFLQD